MEAQNHIFKFKAKEGDPAFFNTVTVVVTYMFVIIFFFKQVSSICDATMTSEMYLDKFVDAIGVSTFTYVFTAALPMQVNSNGTSMFGTNVWMLVLNVIYIILYSLFIPRCFCLNIGLCLFTLVLVFGLSYAITNTYRSLESGQANDHSMEEKRNGEDGYIS